MCGIKLVRWGEILGVWIYMGVVFFCWKRVSAQIDNIGMGDSWFDVFGRTVSGG